MLYTLHRTVIARMLYTYKDSAVLFAVLNGNRETGSVSSV